MFENYIFIRNYLILAYMYFSREILSGTTTSVNSRCGDLHQYDVSWWYHVNKLRAMRGNWSELTPAQRSPQYHVNTPLEHNIGVKVISDNLNTETA